jgi:phosphoadenosine phosphosulfate reductase
VHGKETFLWCDHCGVLALGERCQRCGREGRAFQVSMPGDIRPCFGDGLDRLRDLFERHFGTSEIFDGRLVFLNKISGEDRTDEIVLEGRVIGNLRFRLLKGDFGLELKLDGARMLADRASRGVVRVKQASRHLKGRHIMSDEILQMSDFEPGDPLVALSGNLICAGVARKGSRDLGHGERALTIRDVGKGSIRLPSRRLQWRDFVSANEDHLRGLEAKAVSDIRSFLGNNREKPVTLSFSGGKDSLACYGLASKAVDRFALLFTNTGLEFPETVEFVRGFARRRGLELLEGKAGTAFWEHLKMFGPPAKDFRWCCKVCKLAPLADIIERHFQQGVVTIEGNRVFESFARSRIGFVERNPFVPGQTSLNPIKDWRAAEVWGYIWLEGLEYNPLYDHDLERIGCFLCPASLASEWKVVQELHPDLASDWERTLRDWYVPRGASEEYVEYGLWRWRRLPPKMINLAREIAISLPDLESGGPSLEQVRGARRWPDGSFSVEGVVTLPTGTDFGALVEVLKTLGRVIHSEDYQTALVDIGQASLEMFGGGQIVAVAPSQQEAEEAFQSGVRALLRSNMCTCCGICVRVCKKGAITLDGHPVVDESKCDCCGECGEACVVSHYLDKILISSSFSLRGANRNKK